MLQLCLLLLALLPQEQPRPLPDLKYFLEEFRKTLHSDRALLSQYTYTRKETQVTLDGKGKAKKTEINVYQVIHGAEQWQTYRRQITKDGVDLTEKELAKQDREQKDHIDKETRKHEGQPEAKRKQEKRKEDREEQQALDDVFAMYDIQLVRREMLDGIATILLTFKSRPGYKPKTSDGKILQHIAGRAWVAEEDHELAKLEPEVVDPISIGGGLLAKLQKGSTLAFERRKINNEIWLPVKAETVVNGRLLFKGINLHEVTEYSEHKKYSVNTILKFGDAPLKPKP